MLLEDCSNSRREDSLIYDWNGMPVEPEQKQGRGNAVKTLSPDMCSFAALFSLHFSICVCVRTRTDSVVSCKLHKTILQTLTFWEQRQVMGLQIKTTRKTDSGNLNIDAFRDTS